MIKASDALLELFNVPHSKKQVEAIINSLLYTLNTGGLLNAAVLDITNLTDLQVINHDKLNTIKVVTGTKEFIALQPYPKALQLSIALFAYISNTEEYDVITIDKDIVYNILNRKNKHHVYSELKQVLKQINSLNLGYKLLQKPRSPAINEFIILRYSNKDELITLLTKHKLISPGIIDRLH